MHGGGAAAAATHQTGQQLKRRRQEFGRSMVKAHRRAGSWSLYYNMYLCEIRKKNVRKKTNIAPVVAHNLCVARVDRLKAC